MRAVISAMLIIAIILISTASFLYFNESGSLPPSAPRISSSTATMEAIPVGVVLYLWYGNATSGKGGLGSPGWNNTSCPGGGAVVDRPSIGYYVSESNQTLQNQISEMQGAGVSFAVVSWWGPFTQGESGAINKATLDLFRYLQATNSTFEVAIMVDAFPGTCGPPLPSVPMSQVYDYIQSTFITPFRHWYFQWQGKPLLLFFNPLHPGSDANFTVRTVGNRPNPVNWIFWDAPVSYLQGQGGTDVNMSNDIGDPYISPVDGEVTLVPRIDSYYNYIDRYQSGYLRFDSSLNLGLYQFEWGYVLSHRSEVKLVLIYSWNEYHERTAIEPVNATSPPGQTSLLNQTSSFIAFLESGG